MQFLAERLISFARAYEIFRRELYRDRECLEPYLCNLHEAFGADEGGHNCLGCNFADLTLAFDQVLSGLSNYTDINAPCMTYILWLYLYVERYDQIMNYVNVPDGYRKRHFRAFQRIRRWANFCKHPKSFLFSHHPEYFHGGEVGDESCVIEDDTIQINQKFVDEYYSGGFNNNKLAKILNNATKVVVVYPDPEALMEQFASESQTFVKLIENNEVYREELGQITTVPGYFEAAHPDEESTIG
jgi:hypothetical protein